MESRTYVIDGVELREEMVPDGHFTIESYIPHSTPWDYYGNKQHRTWTLIMAGAGVPCQIRTIRKKRLHPHGTGPNGRVRFGDDMMPSEYHLCIPKRFHETAEKALLEHENSVHKWLHEAGKMPDACRP